MSRTPLAVGAARQYTEKLFGGPCAEQETNFTVGASPVVVARGNGDRVGLIVVNGGVVDCTIAFQGNTNFGITLQLNAFGGSVSMNCIQDFTLPTREWVAFSGLAITGVYVLEIFRVSYSESVGT